MTTRAIVCPIIRNPFVVIVSTVACVHSRAYTCKSPDSGSGTMHLFQAFSNYVAPHGSLHRMPVLMNSRKRHSRGGFFVTLLRGHSKWIVWEVVMDRREYSWKRWKLLDEATNWRSPFRAGSSHYRNPFLLSLLYILFCTYYTILVA